MIGSMAGWLLLASSARPSPSFYLVGAAQMDKDTGCSRRSGPCSRRRATAASGSRTRKLKLSSM